MSPEEVILASGNRLEINPNPKDPGNLIKEGTYTVGQVVFNLEFSFGHGRKLESVDLLIKDSQQEYCDSVGQEINKKYRRGFYKKKDLPFPPTSLIWYGSKVDNLTIVYTNTVIPGQLQTCGIGYSPYSQIDKLKNAANKTVDGL